MPNENLDIDSRTTEQLYEWYLQGNLGNGANLLI